MRFGVLRGCGEIGFHALLGGQFIWFCSDFWDPNATEVDTVRKSARTKDCLAKRGRAVRISSRVRAFPPRRCDNNLKENKISKPPSASGVAFNRGHCVYNGLAWPLRNFAETAFRMSDMAVR